MRLVLVLVAIVGCGEPDLDAPDDCAVDELHIVHGTVDERVIIGNHAFINAFGSNMLGTLDVGNAAMGVHVEFGTLAANGDTVDARGRVTLNGLDVGNCETGDMSGRLLVEDDVWRFELVDLAMAPYCQGAAVSASLGGCYRAR